MTEAKETVGEGLQRNEFEIWLKLYSPHEPTERYVNMWGDDAYKSGRAHDMWRAWQYSSNRADKSATPPLVSKKSDGDYPEDFPHENGDYFRVCTDCGNHFTGHKRRLICKVCAQPPNDAQMVLDALDIQKLRDEVQNYVDSRHPTKALLECTIVEQLDFEIGLRFRSALRYLDEKGYLALTPPKIEGDHCKDCCCERSWKALGITKYTGKSISEHIAELKDALQWLEYESNDLRCYNIPTGGDDYEIGWKVVSHHMTAPEERNEGYGRTPLEAIQAARQRQAVESGE